MEMLKKELKFHKEAWKSSKGQRSPISVGSPGKQAFAKSQFQNSGEFDRMMSSPHSPANKSAFETGQEKLEVVFKVQSKEQG